MLDRFQQEIMFDVVKAQRFLKEGELNALGSVFHRMSGVALLFGARSLGEQLKALRAKAVSAEFSNSDRNSLENIDKEIIKFVTFCEKRYRRNWQISESPSASE